jgi:hypothetical protein
VLPAHNHIALVWIVPVHQEIAAFKFKFNAQPLELVYIAELE